MQQVATLTDAAGADSQIGDLSATINWGDNTTSAATLVATSTPGVYTVEGSHTYAEYGTYAIEVSASDNGGSSVPLTPTASASVADASLTVTAQNIGAVANEGFTLVPVATLTDAAGADSRIGDLSATIDWGDGSPSSPATLVRTTTPGVYTVEGSHMYTTAGTYLATVSAVDTGGSTADDSASPGTATVGNTVWVDDNWQGTLTTGQMVTAPAGEGARGGRIHLRRECLQHHPRRHQWRR